jgi:hypothetical protein
LFHPSVRPSPRWHTQLGAARRAAAKQTNSRATSTARHGPYLLVRVRVRPEPVTEHNPAPSPSSLSTHPQRAREPEKAQGGGPLSLLPLLFSCRFAPPFFSSSPPFRQRREEKRISLSPCRSCLILPLSDKIRLLGFTTLHDTRRYAIPQCWAPHTQTQRKARCTGDDEYAPINLGTRPGRRCWTAVRDRRSISIYLYLCLYLSYLTPSGKFPRYSPLRGTPSSVGRFRLLAEVSLWAHAAGALEGGAGELLWGRWRGGRRQELVSQATRGQGVGWARMHTSRAPPADPSHLPGRLSRGCEPRRQLNHGGSR